MKTYLSLYFVVFLLAGVTASSQDTVDTRQNAREAQFLAQMNGCKMIGRFTVTGSDGEPQTDTYTISKVEKVKGPDWRFHAKIEYGGKSVTVPLIVQVEWAGDTPVIQVTDLGVPVLGKYSARVVIYGDQYAGLWSGADHGGHMFGAIEPLRTDSDQGQDKEQWWSNWRGPDGSCVSPDGEPPTEWSEEKNIRWKVALPGLGSSSPIIWNDRIYVTTAVQTDAEGEPIQLEPIARGGGRPGGERGGRGGGRGEQGGRRGGRRGGGRGAPPTKVHEFAVMALDRATGDVVWSTTVKEAVPHEGGHPTGSQASNSPITDGEHIWAHFGSRGLYCLDLKGEIQWSKEFGYMRTRNQFGEGSSPAVYGDVIVVNWDHEAQSYIVAFDKRTGDELWRKDRDEVTSWSTPLIVDVGGRPQVIVNATKLTRAYDLDTGDLVWSLPGMTTNCIPTATARDGRVWLMSGFRGAMIQCVALEGAKGDLEGSDNVLWSHNRSTSYVPSGLLYGDYYYFLRSNNAVLSCVDATSGEIHYEGERLRDMRSVYASPVGAANHVYLTSREGVTKVIKLGAEFAEVATNRLEDGFDATPAIAGDELYLRGQKHLYCIAKD